MVGCGRSRINNVSPSLKVGIVKLMSRQECSSHLSDLLRRRYSISIGLMCSRNNPYVVMEPGDSGGPLFFQGSLIGLNVGLYPRPNEANTENKVNAHIATNKYSVFIDLHKALE
ncbi:PREDICTED: uncharacterized protein LOC105359601 [Ceratosolen solmsi marchali]|uniref:Uncharacterized protein LOC105359601 n=1 Tax=Ceratosolen solmsi marchali TaxID=326594 RepID=A0AAJ6VJS5_9HYME|nr:PREDICTED: uncharacterized protein LOC105359601 [Ceratosolen solmsi marchali]